MVTVHCSATDLLWSCLHTHMRVTSTAHANTICLHRVNNVVSSHSSTLLWQHMWPGMTCMRSERPNCTMQHSLQPSASIAMKSVPIRSKTIVRGLKEATQSFSRASFIRNMIFQQKVMRISCVNGCMVIAMSVHCTYMYMTHTETHLRMYTTLLPVSNKQEHF